MRYSLSNYTLNIKCNDETMNSVFGVINIGGEGSYLDSISIDVNGNLFDTTSYATGGWVHDKNLARTGTASVNINQLTAQVAKLKQLCKFYYSADYDGLTITVTDADGQEVANCVDCYPQKIPTQEFGKNAAMQTWTFTCGKITFN